jgi:hypothetical protein
MWPLAGTLDTLHARTPPALVSEEAFARVRRAAEGLGAQLTDCVYFESWLGAPRPRTDLIVRIDERGRSLLAQRPETVLATGLAERPAWRRVLEFVRAWAPPEGRWARLFESVWLEFDLPPAAGGAPPDPRVFVDFTRRSLREDEAPLRLAGACETLAVLAGDAFTREAEAMLGRCLAALPAGASVPYVGWSPGEARGVLRVCLRGLGPDRAGALARIGWPGDLEALERAVIAPLRGMGTDAAEPAIVHLDFGPAPIARIGLEYPLRRAEILDRLVERGWCSAAAREATRAWPGRSVEMFAHELWHSRVDRRASHVKVTWAADDDVQAKVYLSCRTRLSPGGTLLRGRPWNATAAAADPPHSRPAATQ